MARFTALIKKMVLTLIASGMMCATGVYAQQSPNVSVVVNRADATYQEYDTTAKYQVVLSAEALQDTMVTVVAQYVTDGSSAKNCLGLSITNITVGVGRSNSAFYGMTIKDGTLNTATGIMLVPTITNAAAQAQYPTAYPGFVAILNNPPNVDTLPSSQPLAPSTSPVSPYDSIIINTPFTFRYKATDIAADVTGAPPITVEFQFEDGSSLFSTGATGTVTKTFNAIGRQTVFMVATDKDGGVGTVPFPINVVAPPSITVLVPPGSASSLENNATSLSFEVYLSRLPSSVGITNPVVVYLDVTPPNDALNGAITVPASVSFNPSQTNRTVYFQVQDGTSLSSSQGFTVTPRIASGAVGDNVYLERNAGEIRVQNVAPVIQFPVNGSTNTIATVGQTCTFNWSVFDVPADNLNMQLVWDWGDGTTTTTTGGSGTTNHIFNTASPQVSVTVRATDKDGGNSTTSFYVTVEYDYDFLKYLAVGVSGVVSIGSTNAVQIVPDNSGDGGTSIKLGGVGLLSDGQMAGIEWTATGSGVLAFDWKVSSEANYDWLKFYEVGDETTNQISGTTGTWSRVIESVTGAANTVHMFRWEYEKDPVSDYVGQDCGWVDAISWTPLRTMTINNGSGDGYYTNNASVFITADVPLSHYEFDRWTGDTNTVANIFSPSTTLAMPNTNITLAATYKPILYTLSVSNGTGGGSYSYASSVEIRASAFGNIRFYRWTGDVGSIADLNAATTTVVTADQTISLTATYSVPLTVNSGTGSGWYPEGSLANISADADPIWKEFAVWTCDTGLLSNAYARATTLTLPTAPVTVTATYKDSIARLTGSHGRIYTESGTVGAITNDAAAGSPSGTPAVKLGGVGVIPDNGFAAFETVVSGSGSILFQWKVSSESNADYLKFKVDGGEVAAISGTKGPWTQVSNRVETAGSHTLRWEYVKNGSLASSTDAGWVDDIVWIGDVSSPVLTPDIISANATNAQLSLDFIGERGIAYVLQTNATLNALGWGDWTTLSPEHAGETNGVHRFNIQPSMLGHEKMFYRIIGR